MMNDEERVMNAISSFIHHSFIIHSSFVHHSSFIIHHFD